VIHPTLSNAAAVLLAVFATLAAVDGVYIHLWRLRLHARPETRREHWLHTMRALLFPPVLVGIFAMPTAGLLLAGVLVIAVADLAFGLWDVAIERESRAVLGGRGSVEYVVHVAVTMVHSGALALALAARPQAAWSLDAPWVLDTAMPEFSATLAWNLLPGSLVLGLLHVWLGVRARSRVEAQPRPATT
jgi:hypothetical protein